MATTEPPFKFITTYWWEKEQHSTPRKQRLMFEHGVFRGCFAEIERTRSGTWLIYYTDRVYYVYQPDIEPSSFYARELVEKVFKNAVGEGKYAARND